MGVLGEVWSLARVTVFGSDNKSGVSFDPVRDIPSLKGKVILVTGGAGDLGKQVALQLARHEPKRLYIADLPREDQGAAVIDEIRAVVPDAPISFLDLDLGSFEAIKKSAAQLCAAEEKLDICVLNAGIMPVRPGLTTDGYEKTFGVNCLGHALFAKLLMPTLLRAAAEPSADVRVVFVSSEGHAMAPRGGIVFGKLKTPCEEITYLKRYGQSKLGVIGVARELARLHPRITFAAVHPGRIATKLGDKLAEESRLVRMTAPLAPLLCVSVEDGAKNHLWAATAPGVESGKYYVPVGVPNKESALGRDEELSKKLWEWIETELKEHA